MFFYTAIRVTLIQIPSVISTYFHNQAIVSARARAQHKKSLSCDIVFEKNELKIKDFWAFKAKSAIETSLLVQRERGINYLIFHFFLHLIMHET